MELKRVVVTGLGALTPLGNDVSSYWNSLISGTSSAAEITNFDPSKFKTRFACEIKDFDVQNHLDRKEARRLDPFAQYAMVASEQAIQDSGLDMDSIDKSRAGVIWGSGIGGLLTFQQEVTGYVEGDGTPRFSPFFIPKMILDIAAGHISIKYGFRGPNFATVSACASSTHAMIDSFNYIRLNKADLILTGGSEAAITEAGVGGFSAMKALSERNDSPQTASRPFDKDREGFVIGEGAGGMVLEELEHAVKRGATIYAEIVGGGVSGDAFHMTAPHPEGLGAKEVMAKALEDAEMDPTEIDYINVHGTSTPLGDVSEVKAIEHIFGDHATKLNISSTKSMTGHLLGAAGAIESIACILAIRNGTIPPTINHITDDPEFNPDLNFTFNEPQNRDVKAALSNTFGFGGHNASVIFRRYED
ncbi:beta-ketoacyl-ACP synthase II [bacterium AH-315-C07]|nr:beta-ketoacyl-ACP synthase II [bacterium AH-315-C07]